MLIEMIIALALLLVWSTVWKGFALWHAARNNQMTWYIALLIINTAGILEIIYLSFFQKSMSRRTIKKPVSRTKAKKRKTRK